MEGHLFCEWRDLFHDFLKLIDSDEFLLAQDLRAETALQVAYIGYFYVNFGILFQLLRSFLDETFSSSSGPLVEFQNEDLGVRSFL